MCKQKAINIQHRIIDTGYVYYMGLIQQEDFLTLKPAKCFTVNY
jgi:hypothetical protein